MNSLLTSAQPQSEPCETIDAICPKHGGYTATVTTFHVTDRPTVITSPCQKCVAERRAEEAAKKREQEAAERRYKVRTLRESSRIPARFADSAFANYSAKEPGQKMAAGVCKAFADSWPEKEKGGGSLVLTGSPGTGKTHLACAIGNTVMDEYLADVLFCTMAVMLRHIKNTYRRDSEKSEQQAINDLVRPGLLILDEVGVQIGSEHEKLLMFEVLNARYQDLSPTILISNLDGAELEDFLGHRIMDRYRECGSVLAFDWQSYRGRA